MIARLFLLAFLLPLLVGAQGISVARLQKGGRFAYTSAAGRLVIPFKYDYLDNFGEGWVAGRWNETWTYVDTAGREMLKLGNRYLYAGIFSDGMAVAYLNTPFIPQGVRHNPDFPYVVFINNKGEEVFHLHDTLLTKVISPSPAKMFFQNGLLALTIPGEGKKGLAHPETIFLNKKGLRVPPPSTEPLPELPESLVRATPEVGNYVGVHKKGHRQQIGLAQASGIMVTPLRYRELIPPADGPGLWAANMEGCIGFIDTKGMLVVPHEYDKTSGFHFGLAVVESSEGIGVVNAQGKMVLPIEKRGPVTIEGGIIKVLISKQFETRIIYQYFDRNGQSMLLEDYDEMEEWQYIK